MQRTIIREQQAASNKRERMGNGRNFFRRGFSLIELLVTMSIIGLLLVSVVPILSGFGRDNAIDLAGQTIREALLEAQNYAISPDSSKCKPTAPGGLSKSNNYYLFFASPAGSSTPDYDTGDAAYKCGNYAGPQDLQDNQYAILAAHIDDAGKVYTNGIVAIGVLDEPAIFASPYNGAGALDQTILMGYQAPSGRFWVSDDAGYNYTVEPADEVNSRNRRFRADATVGLGNKVADKFVMIAAKNRDKDYRLTLFINIATGQVTTGGLAPDGFVAL